MADQQTSGSSESSSVPPAKKGKWGKRILIGVVVVVVLLGLLVALLPTIASMGFVRSIVVGKINDNLNGKVAIADWSLGWTGGIDMSGVTVDDAAGNKVVELKKLHTDLGLIDAVKGKYDLGKVTVDGLRVNVVVDAQWNNNLSTIAKPSASGQTTSSGTTSSGQKSTPQVTGTVVLTDCQVNVSGAGVPQPVGAAIAGQVQLPAGGTITESIQTVMNIAGQSAGKINLDGTLAMSGDEANQKIVLDGVQLSALMPFLPKDQISKLQGITTGQASVVLTKDSAVTIAAQLNTANVAFAGTATKGDVFTTDVLGITVPATSVVPGADKNDEKASRIKTAGPIVVALGKSPKGEELGQVSLLVDTTHTGLMNAVGGKAPGIDGKVETAVNLDLAALARMLPKTMGLVEGVRVDSGKLASKTSVTMTAKEGSLSSVTDLSQITGLNTQSNQAIAVKPVHLEASAVMAGSSPMDYRNLALSLTSGFATASFKGQSVADVGGSAHGDLKALHDELGQVVNFGALDLAGVFDMTLASSGNLADEKGQGKIETKVTFTDLKVAGLAEGKSIVQKWMELTASGTVVRGAKPVDSIQNAMVTLKTGDANSPTVDLAAGANINLAGSVPSIGFALQKLFVDAAKAQAEFSAFVPKDYQLSGGTLSATASGTYSGSSLTLAGLNVEPKNLTVMAGGKPMVSALTMSVDAAGTVAMTDQKTINLTKLNVTEQNNRLTLQKVSDGPLAVTVGAKGFSGQGKLQVGADLPFLNSLANAGSTDVRSGTLSGTLEFNSGSNQSTTVGGNFSVANLSVATATGATDPDTVTIVLAATAPADFSSAVVQQASIKSRFANVAVTDSQLKLDAASTYEKLQKVNVAIDVSDVGQLHAIGQAFNPPAAAPAGTVAVAPLSVTGGHLAVKLNVAGTAGVTTITLSDLSGGDIQLARGSNKYVVQPFSVQMASTIKTSGSQISELDVTQLTGKLGIADLTMDQAISVKNPMGGQPQATGTIRLAGQLQQASALMTVLEGSPIPYNGAYVLVQKLSTEGTTLGLTGTADVTGFQVLGADGKPTVSEDKVSVTNDLKIDNTAKSVSGNLGVTSNAVGVKFAGGLTQFETARVFADNTSLALNYDAAKLWQVLKPMMSADTQKKYADLQIAGVKQTTMKLGGSYPANVPFQQAVQKLTASGALPLDKLSTQGIDATNINPAFALAGGKLTISAAPGAQPIAPPATRTTTTAPTQAMIVTAQVNGGTVDLTGAVLDLTTAEPTLTLPANKAVAHAVALNGVLANYLNSAMPILDTSSQSAVADLTMTRCDNLPLGASMTTAQSKGTAVMVVALAGAKLGGSIVGAVDKYTGGFLGSQLQTSIQPTKIAIASGQATIESLAVAFGQGNKQYFKLSGTVGLAANGPLNLTANIPSDLFKQFSKDLLKYLPAGVDLPIGGTKEHPAIAGADKVLASLGKQALLNATKSGLLGGKSDGKSDGGLGNVIGNVLGNQQEPATPGTTTQQPANKQPSNGDAIGNLLNQFGKKKKSK